MLGNEESLYFWLVLNSALTAERVEEPNLHWNVSGDLLKRLFEPENLAGIIVSGEAEFFPEEPHSLIYCVRSSFYFYSNAFRIINLASVRKFKYAKMVSIQKKLS